MATLSKRLRRELRPLLQTDPDKAMQLIYNAGYRLGLRAKSRKVQALMDQEIVQDHLKESRRVRSPAL
jgi:hypothetical protein